MYPNRGSLANEATEKLLASSDQWETSSAASTLDGGKYTRGISQQATFYRNWLFGLSVICIFLGFACLAMLVHLISITQSSAPQPHGHGPWLNEEINNLVPEFPRTTVLFWNDSNFGPSDHPVSEHEAYWLRLQKNWESLMPRGRGFIAVRNREQYILPPPYPGPPGIDEYGIAVFHQIHCLWLISITLKELGSGEEPGEDLRHIFHCIDYLRLSIMCCGDTALEGADPYHPPEAGTQGIGTTHVCKDYDTIFEWAEERRWTNDGTLLDDPEQSLVDVNEISAVVE